MQHKHPAPHCPHCHGTGIVHGYWSSDDDRDCGCWRDQERLTRALEKRARRGAARTGCTLDEARAAVLASHGYPKAGGERRLRPATDGTPETLSGPAPAATGESSAYVGRTLMGGAPAAPTSDAAVPGAAAGSHGGPAPEEHAVSAQRRAGRVEHCGTPSRPRRGVLPAAVLLALAVSLPPGGR